MQWKQRILPLVLIPLLLIPLITIVTADAINTYEFSEAFTTPRPEIQVVFLEEPVTIADYSFSYQHSASTPPTLTYTASRQGQTQGYYHEFTFTLANPDEALPDEDYSLYIKAHDKDNNVQEINVLFTVNADNMDMWLDNPSNEYLPRSTLGATPTQPFTFSITYDYENYPTVEECKYRFGNPYGSNININDLPTEYNNIPSQQQLTKNPDDHTFSKESFSLPSLADEGELVPIHVICKEKDISGIEPRYHYQLFSVAYDPTPPTYTTLEFNPNPVTEFSPINGVGGRKTTLTVTTDDNTVCEYKNILPPFAATEGNKYQYYFPPPSVTSYEDFTTNKQEELDFTTIITPNDEHLPGPYEYQFLITCTNLAGLTTTEQQQLTLEFPNTLTITTPLDHYQYSTSIEFIAETSLAATTCEADPGTGPQPMTPSDDYKTHTTSLTLEEGANTVTVTCIREGETTTETFSFFVDPTPPGAPTITTDETICGGNTITATFTADDGETGSGINTYHYTLSQGPSQKETTTTEASPSPWRCNQTRTTTSACTQQTTQATKEE